VRDPLDPLFIKKKRKKKRRDLEQRCVDYLNSAGWIAGRCDCNMGLVSRDLFGFADVFAFEPEELWVLLVQVTSRKNHAARRAKCLGSEIARRWVESGHLLDVWSLGDDVDGTKLEHWRVERLTQEMFDGEA